MDQEKNKEVKKIDYKVKELEIKDLDPNLGFLKTLSNLAEVGNLNQKKAEEILEKIKKQDSKILVAITDEGQIIGAVTLMLEQKFLREGSLAGHIEDVVTRKSYQGMGIASALIKKAIEIAKGSGCYKLILDCEDNLISFYSKFGFKENESCMKIYLDN